MGDGSSDPAPQDSSLGQLAGSPAAFGAGLSEAPLTIPVAWDREGRGDELLARARGAADECAKASVAALPGLRGRERRALALVAGVCTFVAAHGDRFDSELALDLCVRMIETNAAMLDRLGATSRCLLAASAARRCAQSCSRALASSRG